MSEKPLPLREATSQFIPIKSVALAKGVKYRPLVKQKVADLASSIEAQGLLQAIGVRPDPAKEGVYLVIWGRHRWEAAKRANLELIEAKVLDISEPEAICAMHAENVFRSELSAADRLIALKEWSAVYKAAHPETTDHTVSREGKVPRFDEVAAQATGQSASTVRKQAKAAEKLDEEQLGVLAEKQVPMETIKELADISDPAKRAEAVSLIASGLPAKEAVVQAKLPPNATISEVVQHDEPGPKPESEMDDDEWLKTFCADILAKLKFSASFRRDAILYRKTRQARADFKAKLKTPVAQARQGGVGPFLFRLLSVINVAHPKDWLHCGPCGGTGQSGDKSKCPACNGHAYKVKTGD